nr:MAG: hypothetical protein OI719_00630 [Candidatus Methanoperedens sp.]
MIDFINQAINIYNTNLNLINFLLAIFGIAGTILTIISWRDSKSKEAENKRKDAIHDYLFKLAEKNIDKTVTDQQLSEKIKEIELATQKIETLQEKIRKDIPLEAKRTVLKDRLNSQIELLKQHFESTKKIRDELAKIETSVEIPSDLLKSIEDEISPEYILKDKRSNLITQLTLVTTGSALTSAILPYPISRWISWTLLLFAIPILLRLIKLSLSPERISQIIYVSLSGSGIVFLISSLFLYMIYLDENIQSTDLLPVIIIIFFGISIVFFVGALLWRKEQIKPFLMKIKIVRLMLNQIKYSKKEIQNSNKK